jgi:phage tail tape-measure protein
MWTEFLLMISNAGVFDWIKNRLQKVLDFVNEMAANGKLEEWSKNISDNLIKAFEWAERFVMKTDWEAVGRGLATGVEALVKMIELLGKATVLARDIATNDGVLVRKDKRELPERKSDPWSGIFRFKDAPPPAPKAPAARKLSSNFTSSSGGSMTVGGKAVVEIVAPPSMFARTASVTAQGSSVPMEVRTGRTMRNAA